MKMRKQQPTNAFLLFRLIERKNRDASYNVNLVIYFICFLFIVYYVDFGVGKNS